MFIATPVRLFLSNWNDAFRVLVFAANSSANEVFSSNPVAALSRFVRKPFKFPPRPLMAFAPTVPNNVDAVAARSNGSSISLSFWMMSCNIPI